jgi:serine/threonine protein kinase
MLDKRGYIKLTDFGLSRLKLAEKDVSVCGTPEYLAPEIIQKSGHSKEVDWWCLGCLIYEMVVGIPPFYSKNRIELFSKIVGNEPILPKNMSYKLKSLLEGLLKKSPKDRLGANSADEIKKHPWFDRINMDKLLSKEL